VGKKVYSVIVWESWYYSAIGFAFAKKKCLTSKKNTHSSMSIRYSERYAFAAPQSDPAEID